MNGNCRFAPTTLFLAGIRSFFNIFELQSIVVRIFAAVIASSRFVAFSGRFIIPSLDCTNLGAVRILSNQPTGKTPHKIGSNDNQNHLGFAKYPFKFSSPRSASSENNLENSAQESEVQPSNFGFEIYSVTSLWGRIKLRDSYPPLHSISK